TLELGCGMKDPAGFELRRDRFLVRMGGIEPRDERLRKARLVGRLGEYRRAITMPDVGALPVHLRRIVSDGEINLQQLGIADLRGIVGDPDGLGMAGAFGTYGVIVGVPGRAASVT